MRVLHVYRTFFPDTQGGLEETIRQLCLTTGTLGVESRVLTLSERPEPREVVVNGIPVVRAKQDFEIASCGFSRAVLGEFAALSAWADVIHFHFPWPFADVLDLLGRCRKPKLVTYHSDIVRQRFFGAVYRPLMHHFLSSMDRIVCTSGNYARSSTVLNRHADKVEAIPIGIDERTYPAPAAAGVGTALDAPYFLFVGVFRYYKGLHVLLDAMREAPYRLLLAGSGPEADALRAQLKRLRLDNVEFLGYVDDAAKVALLTHSMAVVLPSIARSEAFGVSLVEGTMYGRPLVATEVGTGTSFVCVDGENGLVVKPGCAQSLRGALDTLHGDAALRDRFGRASRKRYEALFTGARMGERYRDLYADLLSGRRGPC